MKEKIVDYGTEHPIKIIHGDKNVITGVATDINEGFVVIGHGLKEIPNEGDLGKIIFERDKNRGHWQFYPDKKEI